MSTKIMTPPTGKAVTPAPAEVNPEPGKNTTLTIRYEPIPAAPPPVKPSPSGVEVQGFEYSMHVNDNQRFYLNGELVTWQEIWRLMGVQPGTPLTVKGATIKLIPWQAEG